MRKLTALTILLMMGMATPVFADGMTLTVGSTTLARTTRTVFNDSGGTLTSSSVVIWDNDGAGFEFDRSGFPYVTTTTGADSVWVAGVTTTGSCPDQALCEIVTHGPAITRIANSTDAITEDEKVGTGGVAGEAGAYAEAANAGYLGIAMELREAFTGATTSLGNDNTPMWVYVNIAFD